MCVTNAGMNYKGKHIYVKHIQIMVEEIINWYVSANVVVLMNSKKQRNLKGKKKRTFQKKKNYNFFNSFYYYKPDSVWSSSFSLPFFKAGGDVSRCGETCRLVPLSVEEDTDEDSRSTGIWKYFRIHKSDGDATTDLRLTLYFIGKRGRRKKKFFLDKPPQERWEWNAWTNHFQFGFSAPLWNSLAELKSGTFDWLCRILGR